jgi:response regulator RpfG family c-di-GMP phosphodiesterase
MLSEKEKLDILIHLGNELNRVHDLDILMERILTESRQFVNADAGSIYIRDKNYLDCAYSQNETLQKRLPPDEKLIYSTFKIPINENSIAGYVAATGKSITINDVYKLEPTLPFHFDKKFDQASGYRCQSILTIPLKNAKDEVLGVLQIINAKDEAGQIKSFPKSDEKMMHHFASIAAVALERAQMVRAMILRMIRMAEMRDPMETGPHVNRVAAFSIEIYEGWAKRRNLSPVKIDKTRDILRMAAMLHDVGKISTSDLILKKPDRLDTNEYEIMKLHTLQGARLFLNRQSDYDEAAGIVAFTHHEHWDGSGYPGHIDIKTGEPLPGYQLPDGRAQGKKGQEIPLYGRIVALADVFDALSSRRSYKEPWSQTEIYQRIKSEAGSHFDPELADIFFARIEMIRSIQDRYQDGESKALN